MMLDLNFGVTVSRSDSMEVEGFPANSVAQMEDSGTSNSSIVNAEEALAPSYSGKDEDSSNNSSGFIFGIMRKQMESDGANWVDEANPSPELLTQLLFPVAANGKDWDLELRLGLAASATPQWLNLSFPDSGGGLTEPKGFPQKQQLVRKSRRGPRSRSSQYRGVTFYRRTGRWESHIWDCGKQVYLGGFDTAHAAARAYDRAAIKFRGIDADINFNTGDYEEDIKQTKNLTKEEFVYILRRHSSGFARGSLKSQGPMFRKCGQWEARVGPMLGKNALSEFSNAKCGGSDIVSELGSMTSNNEINLDAIRGNGDNLDLSLGISRNKDGLIGNEKMGVINCHVNGDQKLNAERTKMDGCDASRVNGRQPRSGSVAMASHHPTSKFGSYPGFPPNQLEWIAERRNEGVVVSSSSSPQRFTNWAWQMSGSGKVSPVPVFSIAAASSGFSSFAPVAPPPAIPFNQPTTSTLQS